MPSVKKSEIIKSKYFLHNFRFTLLKIARNRSSFHDFLIKPKMMETFFREMKIFTLKIFFFCCWLQKISFTFVEHERQSDWKILENSAENI